MGTKTRYDKANFYAEDTALLEGLENIDDVYATVIANIGEEEENGNLSPQEAANARQAAFEEYAEIVEMEEEELEDDEDDDDDEDYENEEDDMGVRYSRSNSGVAEFRSATPFGQMLYQLIDEEYEDLASGIQAISDITGHTPENVGMLIAGQMVPDDTLAIEISQAFDSISEDDDSIMGLRLLAEEDREDAVAEDEDYLDDEDPDEEDDDDEEDDEEDEGDDEENYSRYDEKDARIRQLEAKFAEAEVEREVSTRLHNLSRQAEVGFNEGWLPPYVFREIFGGFETEGEQLAAFSSVCDTNQVDPETELYAIQHTIGMFERCGGVINFNQLAYQEPLNPREEQEFDNTESQARRNALARIEARKNNVSL